VERFGNVSLKDELNGTNIHRLSNILALSPEIHNWSMTLTWLESLGSFPLSVFLIEIFYHFTDLCLNLKFEIEVSCKVLAVDLDKLEPTTLLSSERASTVDTGPPIPEKKPTQRAALWFSMGLHILRARGDASYNIDKDHVINREHKGKISIIGSMDPAYSGEFAIAKSVAEGPPSRTLEKGVFLSSSNKPWCIQSPV
jgi:hypothetical protein